MVWRGRGPPNFLLERGLICPMPAWEDVSVDILLENASQSRRDAHIRSVTDSSAIEKTQASQQTCIIDIISYFQQSMMC